MPDHATLQEGGKDGDLVVERSAKSSSVIQVQGKRVVAENLERLVMVSIHVPHEEVQDSHVH